MRDSEVVASIVAGDPLGLATAYDRYADPLFQYCRTLLNDPADAADAVQDAFVIAASRLDGLRDPSRLRPWLYAVARNEALRILRSKQGTPALGEAPGVTDDSGDAAAESERADLRALLEAAAGLNPGEREVIELQLRQGLDPAEVATVLGVSRSHAHGLISRAREQLETCLAVLLVGRAVRAGRGECDELGALLAGWDGRLTILLRKRVHRHIQQCPACGARRALELRPAMLLDLSPSAALAAGAAISLRLARGAPDGLRAHTLTLATGQEVGAVAHRAAVLSRAGAFDHSGFPKAAHGATAGLAAHGGPGGAGVGGARGGGGGGGGVTGALRFPPRHAGTVTAVVAIAAIIAAIAFALTGNSGTARPAADPSPPGAAAAPAGVTSTASASASAAGKTEPSATQAATSAGPTRTTATSPTTAAPSTARPTAAPPSATPTTASPASTPGPTRGTLSESPRGGQLVLRRNGAGRQIDLSGSGSGDWRVTWSLAVANDPENVVSVSAASGTLTSAEPTIAVTVTTSRFLPCGAPWSPTITVSPGGAVFSICTGPSWHFTGGGDSAGGDDAARDMPI